MAIRKRHLASNDLCVSTLCAEYHRVAVNMSAEDDQTQYDELAGGPGAPTPLSQLEVGCCADHGRDANLMQVRQLQASRSVTYSYS